MGPCSNFAPYVINIWHKNNTTMALCHFLGWCVLVRFNFSQNLPQNCFFLGSKIMKFLHEKNMLSKILERGPNIFYFSYQNRPREPKAWFLQSGRKFLKKFNFQFFFGFSVVLSLKINAKFVSDPLSHRNNLPRGYFNGKINFGSFFEKSKMSSW